MNISWSFEGQDTLAASLLRTVDQGTYYDIGCAHPTEISNCSISLKKAGEVLPLMEEMSCVTGRRSVPRISLNRGS